MSPELCEGRPYNNKSDVWALGCLAYGCCMLRPPFDATSIGQLVLKITKGRYTPIDGQVSTKAPTFCCPCTAFLSKTMPSLVDCLSVHPDRRPALLAGAARAGRRLSTVLAGEAAGHLGAAGHEGHCRTAHGPGVPAGSSCRPRRRRRLPVAGAGATATVGTVQEGCCREGTGCPAQERAEPASSSGPSASTQACREAGGCGGDSIGARLRQAESEGPAAAATAATETEAEARRQEGSCHVPASAAAAAAADKINAAVKRPSAAPAAPARYQPAAAAAAAAAPAPSPAPAPRPNAGGGGESGGANAANKGYGPQRRDGAGRIVRTRSEEVRAHQWKRTLELPGRDPLCSALLRTAGPCAGWSIRALLPFFLVSVL
eukprot:SAG22_NODE_7_length_40155_cov_25.241356_18_plen_375_part_00